jgi:hypothetical protein
MVGKTRTYRSILNYRKKRGKSAEMVGKTRTYRSILNHRKKRGKSAEKAGKTRTVLLHVVLHDVLEERLHVLAVNHSGNPHTQLACHIKYTRIGRCGSGSGFSLSCGSESHFNCGSGSATLGTFLPHITHLQRESGTSII